MRWQLEQWCRRGCVLRQRQQRPLELQLECRFPLCLTSHVRCCVPTGCASSTEDIKGPIPSVGSRRQKNHSCVIRRSGCFPSAVRLLKEAAQGDRRNGKALSCF
uniref:Uncharacterized protein n=1 Tax=Caudovirales sp. ctNZz8 TaxID=2826772 RepID=A0A8S5QZ84_9CAUD|nr:MAG TPA: hypothetical protein [Caudovirales sp. ctNZz8]